MQEKSIEITQITQKWVNIHPFLPISLCIVCQPETEAMGVVPANLLEKFKSKPFYEDHRVYTKFFVPPDFFSLRDDQLIVKLPFDLERNLFAEIHFREPAGKVNGVYEKALKRRSVNIMFGRSSEEKPFGPSREKPFIHLRLYSQEKLPKPDWSFEPLYVRVTPLSYTREGTVSYAPFFLRLGAIFSGNEIRISLDRPFEGIPKFLIDCTV